MEEEKITYYGIIIILATLLIAIIWSVVFGHSCCQDSSYFGQERINGTIYCQCKIYEREIAHNGTDFIDVIKSEKWIEEAQPSILRKEFSSVWDKFIDALAERRASGQ